MSEQQFRTIIHSEKKVLHLHSSESMCCQAFFLSHNYEELKQKYNHLKKTGDSNIPDLVQVFEMLIPLGSFDGIKKDKDQEPTLFENQHDIFTCKHLVNNKCSIYDSRPKMCRDYTFCEHPDCKTTSCSCHAKRPENQIKKERL